MAPPLPGNLAAEPWRRASSIMRRLAPPSAAEPYRDGRYSRWFQDEPVDDETTSLQALDDDMQAVLGALPSSFAASCQVMDCDADVLLERLRGGPSLAWLQKGTQP